MSYQNLNLGTIYSAKAPYVQRKNVCMDEHAILFIGITGASRFLQ